MKILTTIFIALLYLNLHGQNKGIDNRELLVEKEYSNEIYDVNPIFNYASIYTPQRSSLNFDTDTLIQTNPFTPDINVFIRPITYQTAQELFGHKGFIKLDRGTTNPYHAQAGYSYSAPNYFNIHGTLEYDQRQEALVANKTIKNIDAQLGMEYYLTNEVKTDISIKYADEQYGLYAFNEMLTGNELENTLGSSLFEVALGLSTFKTSPDQWNFSIHTDLSQWSDTNTESSETNIALRGAIRFRINDNWAMSLTPQYKISNSQDLSNANILKGSYQISYNTPSFYTNAGITVDLYQEQVQLWPKVDIRWNVAHNTNINITSNALATVLGGQYLRSINPYQSLDQLINNDKMISYHKNISVDIDSDLSDDTAFKVEIGYVNAVQDVNFRTSFNDMRTFQFEQVDYQLLSLSFDLRKKIFGEMLSTGIKVQYDNYANYNTPLFNRPSFIVSPIIESHLLNQKLHLRLSGLVNNPQTLDLTPSINSHSEWRKNFSFGLTYNLTNQLNINFNADNILNDEYQVWRGYNNFERNLSGGILFKF